jgi:hypothetical protein
MPVVNTTQAQLVTSFKQLEEVAHDGTSHQIGRPGMGR